MPFHSRRRVFFSALWMLRKSRVVHSLPRFVFSVAFPVLGFFNLSYFMTGLDPVVTMPFFGPIIFNIWPTSRSSLPCFGGSSVVARRPSICVSIVSFRLWLTLLGLLASSTWVYRADYRDNGNLFSRRLSKNPNSATAHNNLGNALF